MILKLYLSFVVYSFMNADAEENKFKLKIQMDPPPPPGVEGDDESRCVVYPPASSSSIVTRLPPKS